MKYNELGKVNLNVSEIGLGAMSLVQGHESTNSYILEQALAIGINYLDTSDLYDKGKNEALIGRLIKDNRKQWILASKVGNKWREDGTGWDWVPTKAYILKSIDESLLRLQTDYLDLYQLHGGTIEDPFDEIIEAFEILIDQGKILNYGISSIRPNVFLRYAKESNIISNMMQYSLFDRRPEGYFDQLAAQKIAVFARGTVAQGLLLDKHATKYLNTSVHEILAAQQAFKKIALDNDLSPLALALKYPLLSYPPVVCSVLGIRTKAQIQDLEYAIQEMERIDSNTYQKVLDLLPEQDYNDHKQ